MTHPADLTILLLAAGQSRRFGEENKLLAPLKGRPLVLHAAAKAPEGRRIAVCTCAEVAALLPDWEILMLEGAPPQSASLKAGIAAAGAASHVLVLLGDMPNVSETLIADLLTYPEGACAFDGETCSPPALLPHAMFAEILTLEGDRGAGALLRQLPFRLPAGPIELADIDTQEDLAGFVKFGQNFGEH